MYGEGWQFGAGGDDDEGQSSGFAVDTAYTTEALGVHNDATYFSQPPGLQVRSCLGLCYSVASVCRPYEMYCG